MQDSVRPLGPLAVVLSGTPGTNYRHCRLQLRPGVYKNGFDVLLNVVRKEGFFCLWKGFVPYYSRLGPHTVLTFIFLEQLRILHWRMSS